MFFVDIISFLFVLLSLIPQNYEHSHCKQQQYHSSQSAYDHADVLFLQSLLRVRSGLVTVRVNVRWSERFKLFWPFLFVPSRWIYNGRQTLFMDLF